jgi:hypothetical protein
MLNVGAALEGYVDSLPGIGRNSYGYCNDGRVGLECELAPEDAPKIESGDFSTYINRFRELSQTNQTRSKRSKKILEFFGVFKAECSTPLMLRTNDIYNLPY